MMSMGSPTYYHIANLLEKMSSVDKDFRFMATNDLMSELQKDSIKLDDETEKKVVKMVLKLLEDKNGEVQNLAVKCLGPLVNKVKAYQVEYIVENLCNNLVSEKEELRDISSIALKTVINDFPLSCNDLISSISHKLINNLLKTIAKQDDTSVQLEALDMIGDIINRFGNHVTSQHNMIEETLMSQISNNRLAVRKRSIMSLSYLTIICSQQLFAKIINFLTDQIYHNKSSSLTRSYIQCVGVISRTSATRLAPFLPKIIPLLINFCKKPHSNLSSNGHCSGSQQEEDDELKEYCLQAFESTIKRCTKDMSPFISEIIDLCLDFIAYDPNYNYEDDEESTKMDADFNNTASNTLSAEPDLDPDDLYEGGSENGEPEQDEYSEDDEDLCWKVRRAGAKCLLAVVEFRADMLAEFYNRISPVLISRFKEREENVKLDLLQVYCTLLRQTQQALMECTKHHGQIANGASPYYIASARLESMDIGESPPQVLQLLQGQVPNLVRAMRKLIKHKSPKIKQGCFALLTKLAQTYPSSLASHMPTIIAGILHSLSDDNAASNMKIETLIFLSSLLSTHEASAFHPYIHQLVPTIIAAINDPFYKIVSEALSVTEKIVKIMRPTRSQDNGPSDFSYKSCVLQLYNATLNRLYVTDIDQEVKEKAISCMAHIINVFGDVLRDELKVCLPIFGDRMKNEITRLAAVKAIQFIVSSPHKMDVQPIAVDYVLSLGHFLRKNNRALKLSAVLTLQTLIANYSDTVSDEILNKAVIVELPQLISDNDLRMSDLVLQLLSTIAQTHPACIAEVWKNRGNKGDYETSLISELLVLMKSPLLQGEALHSLIKFFKNVVKISIPDTDFKSLIDVITVPVQHYDSNSAPVPSARRGLVNAMAAPSSSLNLPNRPTAHQSYNMASGSGGGLLPPQASSPTNCHLHKQALSNIAKVVGAMASVRPEAPGQPDGVGQNLEPNPNQVYLAQKFYADVRTYTSTLGPVNLTPSPQSVDCGAVGGTSSPMPGGTTSPVSEASTVKIVFALLVLGEVGRASHILNHLAPDDSKNAGHKGTSCWSLLSECFSAPVEDVKFAAAFAIGNLGVGNLEIFLPYILTEIGKHPKKQYLTLHALKEVINGQLGITAHDERSDVVRAGRHHPTPMEESDSKVVEYQPARTTSSSSSLSRQARPSLLKPYMGDLWALLLSEGLLDSPEEGTRTVTAECLGKLCLLDSGARIPDLAGRVVGASALAKCTILCAIIYAISSQPDQSQPEVDKVLKVHFSQFLSCLQDEDINVRRVALVALNSAAHNKPFLIKDMLNSILPHLYNETKIRKELIREVEMGPFKHSVDDGLDIRKTAYECMYTLVDSPACFNKLELDTFLNHVENGLKDHYDIKMLTYLMLARLATLSPLVVLNRFDRLIEPLKYVIVSKVKANSVKQEHEKQEDLKRCALRAIASLLFIPGADKNPHAIEFMNFLRGGSELSSLYETVQKEFIHQQQQQIQAYASLGGLGSTSV